MRCFRLLAFLAVVFGEKAFCRAIHEQASTSTVSARQSISSSSPVASSSAPQTQPPITTCSPVSTITITTTVTATAPARGKETTTQPPTSQSTSGNTTAQIIGIAMGSSTIVGVVAAFFFFAGHRSNRRRRSTHSTSPNLKSFRKKLDQRWKKKFIRNTCSGHGRVAPAELEATAEAREVSMPPARPVNNEPVFDHLVTPASSVARGLDIIPSSPTLPPAALLQPLRVEILPVELPTFDDPGTSPLPEYEEVDAARRHQTFSWGAPEATYRPDKFPHMF